MEKGDGGLRDGGKSPFPGLHLKVHIPSNESPLKVEVGSNNPYSQVIGI